MIKIRTKFNEIFSRFCATFTSTSEFDTSPITTTIPTGVILIKFFDDPHGERSYLLFIFGDSF